MTIRCPRLDQLPPPPPGKTDWPWTEEAPQLPDTMPDGQPWPRLSIITPSYNQARFLEETIRSVLLQGYPNLEYIVIDGGSTDASVEIIRKYADWITFWESVPDRGQSHAVNKGLAKATGEFVAWLNSDDIYLPDAFRRAVSELCRRPKVALLYTDGLWINEVGRHLKIQTSGPHDARRLLTSSEYGIPQPTAFMRRAAMQSVGGLDETLHMAMDLDLWVKLALRYDLHYVAGKPIAALRFHTSQKTQTRVFEGWIADLYVFDRALHDPLCPLGVQVKGNRAYARLCRELALLYFRERRDLRHGLKYFMLAGRSHLSDTIYQTMYFLTVRTYRAVVPPPIQTLLRRMRGTEAARLADLGY